jgi:GNAT superfamily N-acetyltransferase
VPEVRRASPVDVDAVALSLGRAFVDDPVASYIFPAAARREELLRRFFALQLRHSYLPRGEVYTVETGLAAALWMPPSPPAAGWADVVAHVPLLALLAGRFFATRRLSMMLASHHPRTRHYYLGTIGTDPSCRGRGVGSALMAPVLERCDSAQLPAYLECSKRENVAFYGHHGFAVTREVVAPGGGPQLWLMWREPVRL